jgi:hypothetical protein
MSSATTLIVRRFLVAVDNLKLEERILRQLFSDIMLTDSTVSYPQLPPRTRQGMIRYGYMDNYQTYVGSYD